MSSRNKKYIVMVGDGMGDYPLPELEGRTPLEVANTPNMDRIAACGIGLVRTIPAGMEPGSDVANLALLGYDPGAFHTGRAPFEAASMGLKLKPEEVAFRMNLVTLDRRSESEILMVSHSAGDISTGEGGRIVETLREVLVHPGVSIYAGVAYRNLLVWDGGPVGAATIPPHDVLDQNMAPYLGQEGNNPVLALIRRSWPVLETHPVNAVRRKKGLKEANSIWLWGQGKAPRLQLFSERYGLLGGVISAVDLIKGIGVFAGFTPIKVEGATGYLDTNYLGKAEAALEGLESLDFMFLHVEAPDEASHNGNYKEKIQAIEQFDNKVVGTVIRGLRRFDDYAVMVASDHLTPIPKRTHTGEPTPFAWARKHALESGPVGPGFTERAAKASGLYFERGHELMGRFITQVDRPTQRRGG